MSFNPVQNQPNTLAGAGCSIGDSTLLLTSFLAIDGVTPLTMTMFGSKGYATIEPGNGVQEEQVSFTGITQNANGTATLTGISTVLFISPYTETANVGKTHPGGAQFVISNTAGFYNQFAILSDNENVTGLWNFSQNPTGINPGAVPDSSTTTKGIGKVSVAPVLSTNPIFVGDNDNRVPPTNTSTITAAIVAALAGTGTPSGANKFVTADTNALNQLLSNLSTDGTMGGGSPSTTLYPSQSAIQTYVNSAATTFTSGTTTKNVADASTAQTIAHSLGRIPKTVHIICRALLSTTTNGHAVAEAYYNGTTQSSQSIYYNNAIVAGAVFILNGDQTSGGNSGQTGVITFDGTNITITWTKAGTPTGTFQILWSAQ